MGEVFNKYWTLVEAGKINQNAAQERLLIKLDALEKALSKPLKRSYFRKAFAQPRGLYIWGTVGSGKSFLMDLFVDSVDLKSRRVHFHAFMQDVQNNLHIARESSSPDALVIVAKNIIKGIRLLALDEMYIKDIADAMIVGRLFELIKAEGVVILTTSNVEPDDLYKGGLNRQLFLPFIAFLKNWLDIHDMMSDVDFRQNRIAGSQVYFAPLNSLAEEKLDIIWKNLSDGVERRHKIHVKGRELCIPRYHNGVGRLSFHALCSQPLGPADYLAVAEALRVLIIDRIPKMGHHNFSEARRFVTLIDVLYEAKTRLICSAEAEPEMLYLHGEGAFEFKRTASRLREMQSADWIS